MIAALAALVLALTPAPILVEQPPLVDLSAGATATDVAVRVDPPPPPPPIEEVTPAPPPPPAAPSGSSASSNGRCVGWEPLLASYSPGWDVQRMSKIMYRESRCQAEVRSPSGATGLLQIMPMHCSWISGCTVARLRQGEFNINAAAQLWRRQGYAAWSTS